MRPDNSLRQRRLRREWKTIQVMISMYCRAHHDSLANELCEDCQQLETYVERRLRRCPYGDSKPTCAKCPTHCYKPDMRATVQRVMRYAGPRMLFRHPYLTVMHLADSRRSTIKEPDE